MRRRAVRAAAACAALLFGVPAAAVVDARPAAETGPELAIALADTASRLCVDVVSRKVALPAAPGDNAWHAGYGVSEGMPKEATTAILAIPSGGALISRATLMSGQARDGAFAIGIGGTAGDTCRILVYRASAADGLAARTSAALAASARGWKPLPTPSQYAVANKLSLLLRHDGKPYLANLLTPTTPGPVALAIIVAAIPPQVTLPPGY